MNEITAAVCRAFDSPLSIEQLHMVDPGVGELEIDLEACAVCHSDISYVVGDWGGALPAVFGHEAVGRVRRVGTGATGAAVGDRVLVTLLRACGVCRSCVTGQPALCVDKKKTAPLTDKTGQTVTQGMNCAAFAEKVLVHQSQVCPIAEDIPASAACLLSCGVITGVGSVVGAGKVRPGDTVVVIGAGGVGLNAIQGARLAGASRIVAVDLNPEKLEDAKAFGATDGVLATEDKPWKPAIAAMGRGADAVFVTVGAIAAYASAPRYLGPGGRMVIVGMPPSDAETGYSPVILAALGQGFLGAMMGDTVLRRDIPWMVDLYRQGRLKLDELVSRTWSLDEINEAIADTRSGSARRNVIVFDETR